MAAQVLPMFDSRLEGQEDWTARCVPPLSKMLGDILRGLSTYKISDISSALFSRKADLLGQMLLAFFQKYHGALLEHEHCACPQCKRVLKRRGMHKRPVETMPGVLELERPYFYCTRCSLGLYPLDDALGLCPAIKQDDIQSVGVFLATEVSYEVARETHQRCTGQDFNKHSMHESVNRVADGLGILDVCPSKEEVEEKVARIGEGKRWRPVMMMTFDGAQEPVRPEPSPRKGDWKEVKGFRIYLIDEDRIEHVMSWHQMADHHEIADALRTIKGAGLIPQEKVRLCVVADGAGLDLEQSPGALLRCQEVMDFYHCSEYLHKVAAAQYGKGSEKAFEWVYATLVRLSISEQSQVIAGLKRMKPASDEARKLIANAIEHLSISPNTAAGSIMPPPGGAATTLDPVRSNRPIK